jgi:CubicO group peptidase (beta-lactamase class C family)
MALFTDRENMNIRAIIRFSYVALIFSVPFPTAAEDFTNAVHQYLQQRADIGTTVGFVDEHGSRVVSAGKLDNGADQKVNSDTLFEIGSVTKTFTTLLLQEMVEGGRMKLEDPVAKYLPKSVKMPTRNGKQITLLQLATHTSGLPKIPDNLDPKHADNPYGDYTVEKMYAFLSRYKSSRNQEAEWQY